MGRPNLYRVLLPCLICLCSIGLAIGGEPLHRRIHLNIVDRFKGKVAERSTDAEFIRRVFLDLAGTIPSSKEVRSFLEDTLPDKRMQLIDKLLSAPSYARRMRQALDVVLMQRRVAAQVPSAEWESYLEESFAQNKPWDQFVRELITADGIEAKTRPAMSFLLARGATNHKEQARGLGVLLLGRDLQCAQCHDHPTINDFKQRDFYGLVAFLNRSYLYQDKKSQQSFFVEKGIVDELKYSSAFTGETGVAVPHLLGGSVVEVPSFEKGKELAQEATEGKPPLPKFPLRPKLAKSLVAAENKLFARNAANRFWAMMMGRGLVHPLDMHHAENPPSHPELLDLLSVNFAANKFDVKGFLRELALTESYQRSSRLPADADNLPAQSFAVANSKPLSPEQLVWSVLQATGNLERVVAARPTPEATKKYRPDKGHKIPAENLDNVLKLFRAVYAAQPGESEDEFNPSLAGALFVSNEELLLKWLTPQPGNLIDRLLKLTEPQAVANELYLSILSREPTEAEGADVAEYLKDVPDGRESALREMAWALLATTEFRLNH